MVLDAAHFETDKAFPLPAALSAFRAVAKLAHDEPKRALLVLGHTDAGRGTLLKRTISFLAALLLVASCGPREPECFKLPSARRSSRQW